jgi:23S rRNA-/tRNA-specific pseudouridylate synthase
MFLHCRVVDTRREYKVIVHHQGQPAATEYRRLKLLRLRLGPHRHQHQEEKGEQQQQQQDEEVYSLLEVSPISGRTHQVRSRKPQNNYHTLPPKFSSNDEMR